MNAKTSYFNKKIFTHNLIQVLPFLLLMSGIMAAITLFTISHVIQQSIQSSFDYDHETLIIMLKNTLCDNTSVALVKVLMACYSFFCGVSVFRYLFQKKLCQTIHALPMKRSGLYLTNLLSGLVMLAIPFLFSILALCLYLPIKGYGAACSVLPLWFLVSIGFCLIFYALSILAVMLTGHLFATPIVYFILNFGIFIGEMLLHSFVSAFFFGMQADYVEISKLSILTPFVHLWQTLRLQNASSLTLASYLSEGLEALVIYALVSLVIFAVCRLLYQIRKLEYQGDPIVLKPVQPVFLYIGVILGSIIIAIILYNMSYYNMYAAAYDNYTLTALFIYFMLSSVVLYFVINMLLKKTVHVFRSNYKGITVYCCIALSLFLFIRMDVLGIETKTPEVKELSSICLS
ncbi:MAG: hypothetical protein HFI75_05350 [Lachnospiraceae bacterium]|nr:hypothetical protein [Lachnospiraceae bacterium]